MEKRITVDGNVHFGKPCVAGTRVTVQNVLELIGEGLSFNEIISSYYPDLEIEDIKACVNYAINVLSVEDLHVKLVA